MWILVNDISNSSSHRVGISTTSPAKRSRQKASAFLFQLFLSGNPSAPTKKRFCPLWRSVSPIRYSIQEAFSRVSPEVSFIADFRFNEDGKKYWPPQTGNANITVKSYYPNVNFILTIKHEKTWAKGKF